MIPQHDKQGNRVQLLYYSSTAHYCLSFRRSLVTDRQGGIHLRVNHCRYFVPRRGGGKLSMTSSRTGVQLYTTVQSPTTACHSDAAWLLAGREESVFAPNILLRLSFTIQMFRSRRGGGKLSMTSSRTGVQLLFYRPTAHYCLSFRCSLATSRQGGIHFRSNHFTTVIIYNSDASLPPMTGRFHTSF